MDHLRRPHGDDRHTHSTNDAYVRGYPYGWGNFPDMHSLPSYVSTQSSRDDYRHDVYEHGDGHDSPGSLGSSPRMRYSHPRHRGTAGAPAGYGTERYPPTMPARSASGTGDQPRTRRRYADGLYPTRCFIGQAFGNKNRASLEDDGTCELTFDDDPSLYLGEAPPQIPEDIDGLVIGRFVGNLNSGRIGGKAKMIMTYKPQRARKTGNRPSSPVGVFNDSRTHSRGREHQSTHGFTMFAPQSAQTVTSTFAADAREQTLGQAPSGERYHQTRRR